MKLADASWPRRRRRVFYDFVLCVLPVCVCVSVCVCVRVCAIVCILRMFAKLMPETKDNGTGSRIEKNLADTPSKNHPRKFSNLLMDDNLRFKWSARAGIGGWPIKNKTNSIRAPATREATIASQCPGPIVCLMKERCSGKFLKDFTGSCLISEGGRK